MGKVTFTIFNANDIKKITKTIIKNIVDDYISKNSYIPQLYVLVVSCALSKEQNEKIGE